jgi:hypothetical protein
VRHGFEPKVYRETGKKLVKAARIRRSLSDNDLKEKIRDGVVNAHLKLAKGLALEIENLMGYLFISTRNALLEAQRELKKATLGWRKPVSVNRTFKDDSGEVYEQPEENYLGYKPIPLGPDEETQPIPIGVLLGLLKKNLSEREYQIIEGLIKGEEPKEIATKLNPPVTPGQVSVLSAN